MTQHHQGLPEIFHMHQILTRHIRLSLRVAALLFVLAPGTVFSQDAPASADAAPVMPSLWDLAIQGGWFMIPIGIASIVTVAFTLERLFGLRRGRNLPRKLVHRLRELMAEPRLDPRKMWEACEGSQSPLANVVRAAVLKTGRPQAELEKAVEDAVGRETENMTRNMRPINVVASIAPLLGLLGTVQGMIMAFMVTSTTSSTGTAKAQELAHGIYTALVTTFAGLTVAVVSVVLANFLEGRIERLLKKMEGIFLDLLPQLERYEGRIRISESNDPEDNGIRVKQTSSASSSAALPEAAAVVEKVKKAAPRKAEPSVKPSRPAKAQTTDPVVSETPIPARAAAKTSAPAVETLRANFDR